MKQIEDIFNIATTLADFVELGLADDQARSTQAKATATALKKLIVACDLTKQTETKKVYIRAKSNIAKAVAWEHPTFADGLEFNSHLKIEDVKFGNSNGRKWVKTVCIPCGADGVSSTNDTKIIIWSEFKSQLPEYHGETALQGEVIATKWQVKGSVEMGGKFNKKFHEVTAKCLFENDLMPKKGK